MTNKTSEVKFCLSWLLCLNQSPKIRKQQVTYVCHTYANCTFLNSVPQAPWSCSF